MRSTNENIFKVGVEASGEGLIGYKYHLDYIVNSFLKTKRNLSITGIKRIGKTSLAKESMRLLKEKDAKRFFIVEVDLAACDDYLMFLQSIVNKAQRIIRRDEELSQDSDLEELLEACRNDRNDKSSLKYSLEELLFEINQLGKSVILLIDEFDAATELFTSISDFEYLRNLSSNSDMDISLLLISRRQIYMIEKRNVNNSTFHGVITTYPINGFNDDDMEEFFDKLKHLYGISLPEELKERIQYYAGRSPYIWSMYGSSIVDEYDDEKGVDIDCLFKKKEIDIQAHYKAVYENLSSDTIRNEKPSSTSIKKILEILYGPNFDVSQTDIKILKELGYLSIDNEGRYYSISHYFTDYLRGKMYKLEGSFFDNIIRTEKSVKKIIDIEMPNLCSVYRISDSSINGLQGKLLLTMGVLDSGRLSVHDTSLRNNKAIFHQESTYLDVISLKDSFKILAKCWDSHFAKYFKDTKFDYWDKKFQLCAKARNPVAHGHEEYLSDEERKDVELICKEICDFLAGYEVPCDGQREERLKDYIRKDESVVLCTPDEQLLLESASMYIKEISGKNCSNLRGIIDGKYPAVIPKNKLIGKELKDYLEKEVTVRIIKINNGMYEAEFLK